MTDYVVLVAGNNATIALKGYEPQGAGEQMGSFSLDVDPINAQTDKTEITGNGSDHNFILMAQQALEANPDFTGNAKTLTFFDKASNAPVHDETAPEAKDLDNIPDEDEQERDDAGDEGVEDEDEHDGETIAQLKERLATVTNKEALEADYKAEQEGKNRQGAIAAYEARAAELNEAPAE